MFIIKDMKNKAKEIRRAIAANSYREKMAKSYEFNGRTDSKENIETMEVRSA